MKSKNEINTIYIGYDEREATAYEVLKFSICPQLNIIRLDQFFLG